MQPQQRIRSLQIGLSGQAVELYVKDWSTSIEDATTEMRHVRDVVKPTQQWPDWRSRE